MDGLEQQTKLAGEVLAQLDRGAAIAIEHGLIGCDACMSDTQRDAQAARMQLRGMVEQRRTGNA